MADGPAVAERVNVLTPSGDLKSIPAEKAEAARRRDYQILTPEEARKVKIEQEESTIGRQIAGGVESAASGASFGLSRIAEREIGEAFDIEALSPERMRARESEAMEMVGGIAPLLLTGGAGAAAKGGAALGARALSAPVRGAAALGRAGEAAAAKALARAGTGRGAALARSVAPTAVRGGIEGGLGGVGATIDESVLGETEITGERLATGFLGGTILGGLGDVAVSKGLPAIARGVSGVSEKAVKRVLDTSTGVDAPARAVSAYAKAVDLAGTGQGKVVAELGDLARTAEGSRRVLDAMDPRASHETVGRAIKGAADDALGAENALRAYSGGTRKWRGSEVDGRILDDMERQHGVATEQFAAHASQLDDVMGTLERSDFSHGSVANAQKHVRRAQMELEGAATPADVARIKDALKRDIDQVIKPLRSKAKRGDLTDYDRDGMDVIGNVRRALKEDLEDVGMWGKQAEAQKEANAAISAYLDRLDQAPPRIRAAFEGGKLGEMDPKTALSLARSSGEFRGEADHAALKELFELKRQKNEVVAKYFDLDPAEKALHAKAVASDERLSKILADHSETARLAEMTEKLRIDESGRSVSLTNPLGPWSGVASGGAIGGMIGGPVGALAGAVVGAVSRPYTTIRTLAGIRQAIDRMGVRQAGALAKVAKAGRKGRVVASAAGRRIKRATPAAAGRASTYGRDPEKNYEESRKALAGLQSPGALEQALDRQLWATTDVAPKASMHARLTAQRAVSFLTSKIPAAYVSPLGGKPRVSRERAIRFGRYLATVQDPWSVIDSVADGSMSTEQAEALAIVYPKIYEQIGEELHTKVAEAAANGTPMDRTVRVALGRLLGITTDAVLVPETTATIQMALAPSAEPGQPEQGQPSQIRKTSPHTERNDRSTSVDSLLAGPGSA